MKLSERIEALAGIMQQKAVEASYSRSEQERTVGVVFEEISGLLFTLSTDLDWDERLEEENEE